MWFTVYIPVRKTPFILVCLCIHSVLFSCSFWVPSCLQALILPNNSYSNHTLTSLSWTDSDAQLTTPLLLSKNFCSLTFSLFEKHSLHTLKTGGLLRCTVWDIFSGNALGLYCSVPDFNQQWLSPTQACLNRILRKPELSANYSEGRSSLINQNFCLQAMFFPVSPSLLLQLSSSC